MLITASTQQNPIPKTQNALYRCNTAYSAFTFFMFRHNQPTWRHIEKAVILQRKRKVLNACQEYPGISKSIYENLTLQYAKKTSHL